MTRAAQQDESFLANVIASMIAGIFLVIPLAMLASFYLLKGPISRTLNLEERSLHLTAWKWLFIPLKWLAVAGFVYGAVQAALLFSHTSRFPEPGFIYAMLYLALALLAAFIFNVVHWMEQLYQTPAIQKKLAGLQAERFVSQLINAHLAHYTDAKALHGVLFVFNPGLPNEFSVEADHLLITARHIFVIETKYKSGTIAAHATAPQWHITTAHGQSTMRNALKQAKNAAQVLARECKLPCMPIPLVAIQGKDLTITDAPTNVVPAEEIVQVIDAFEASQPKPLFSSDQVLSVLREHIATDKGALQRHIARAEQAASRAAMASIVESASLH